MDDMVCAFLWMAMLAYVIYLDGYDIIVEDVEPI